MNTHQTKIAEPVLSPKRINDKANILESLLNKSISKQKDPYKMQIVIERTKFPGAVIAKAILQLMPRYGIQPRKYLTPLRELLDKKISPDETEQFETDLDVEENSEYDDQRSMTRVFKAVASEKNLSITILGVAAKQSRNGSIAKSYFDHELSAGKMLKDGVIDFKEINKYPTVNADDKLFYIINEYQGLPGLSFDGKLIPVKEALPYIIQTGDGVERIEDLDSTGKSKGFYLKSLKTGVVLQEKNAKGKIISIDIKDMIEIQKLDYSTGNIGTRFTCPISLKVTEICGGFKIRVNGKVDADFVDGGEIITNNEAVIVKAQSGSSILALKDITASSVIRSKLISEKGTITIERELIDSQLSAPKIIFEKSKGLVTNTRFESQRLTLKGNYFSSDNIIYFGNSLFVEEIEARKALSSARAKQQALENNEKMAAGQLQLELKRMARLAAENQKIVQPVKALIMAVKTKDYKKIYQQIEAITQQDESEEKTETKAALNLKNIFETMENAPAGIEVCKKKEAQLLKDLDGIKQQMTRMELTIEGTLRSGASIKIFCGIQDDEDLAEPDFILEPDTADTKYIMAKCAYSPGKGFEMIQ